MATKTGNTVLDTLLALGQQIAAAIAKSQGKASVDWGALLHDLNVQQLFDGLRRPDVIAAAAAIEAKRTALLAGRSPFDLTTGESDGYAALGDAFVLLRSADLAGALDANFLAWAAEYAVPILERLAPIVLPLLIAAI